MASTTTEPEISARARAIADGLIRTKRARHPGTLDLGMLRLKSKKGGYYWISLNGSRILSGAKLFNAEGAAAQIRRRYGASWTFDRRISSPARSRV